MTTHITNENIVIMIDNNVAGTLYFAKQDDTTYIITKVYVYPNYRGRKLAHILVKTAVDYAKDNSYKLIPHCSYAVAEFKKFKEYSSVLK